MDALHVINTAPKKQAPHCSSQSAGGNSQSLKFRLHESFIGMTLGALGDIFKD